MQSKRSERNRFNRLALLVVAVLALQAIASSFVSRGSGVELSTASGKACMACCMGGPTCSMPNAWMGCNKQTLNATSLAATFPVPSSLDLPCPLAPQAVGAIWDEQPVKQTGQRLSWECDLPPPEGFYGILSNRAPPSL